MYPKSNGFIKKEWLCQFVAFCIFYLDSIIYVEHEGIHFSSSPTIDLLFLLYETILFLSINYILIPKFFYPKKYLLFFCLFIASIILFGIVEEVLVEKILTPDTRGANDLTWQSIYWFFGEILIPLLTFITIKFVFDNFNQKQRLEKIEQDRLSSELKVLKSQMQPHIIFNSLNNLYHFTLEKSEQVPELVLKLSNVLRYVLYETSDDTVPLSKEIEFISAYIDLQKIQYQERGLIHFQSNIEQKNGPYKIVPFLLIPFIENSFKHSFNTKLFDVFIDIQMSVKDHHFHFSVKNNFEKPALNNKELTVGGIGLANVKKRLSLLYPNRHSLKIKQEEQVYIVNLSIQLG